MSVKIWCPNCYTRYTLKPQEGLEQKKVTCKQCQQKFQVGEAMQPPTASRADAPDNEPRVPASAKPPVVRSTHQPVSNRLSSQTSSEVDMSQFFIGTATGVFHPSQSAEMTSSSSLSPTTATTNAARKPRHDNNPWMVPAIVGAVLFSLLLAVASFSWRVYHIISHVRVADAKPVVARPQQNTETISAEATPADLTAANTFDYENTNNENTNNGIDNKNMRLPSNVAADNQQSGFDRQYAMSDEQRSIERKKIIERQRTDLEKEIRQQEVARQKRNEKYKNERLERDELRRLKAANKLHLKNMESEADSRPMENLISRIPAASWGAKSLVMGNGHFVFMGTTKGVQVWDCQAGKIVDDTAKRNQRPRVEALALNLDETMLAAGSEKGNIDLFSVSEKGTLEAVGLLNHDLNAIDQLTFSKDGTRIVSINKNGTICFWDVGNLQLIKSDKYFSGQLAAASSELENSHIRFSDGNQWKEVNFADGEIVDEGEYPFKFSKQAIFLSDPKFILNASGSDIKLYQQSQADPVLRMKGNGVQWTATNEGKNHVLTGGTKRVYQWDITDGSLTHVWSAPDASYIKIISVSADGSKMAFTSASSNQDVYVFDLQKSETIE